MVQVELGAELEEQLTSTAQAKGLSLNEYLRQELESKVAIDPRSEEEIRVERRAAVDSLRNFAKERKLTLGPDLTLKDLRDEGRR